ncbi:hypothetical protein Tco_0339185 [Tanacetum coccineum]
MGPTTSLGKVARERIPGELSPSKYPGRHVAGDEYPQRHVPREGVKMSLGIVVNVVVVEEEAARRQKLVTIKFIESNCVKFETTTVEGTIVLAQYYRENLLRKQEMELKLLQARWMEQQATKSSGVEGGSPRQDDTVESSESLKHVPDSSIAAYGTKAKAKGESVRKRPREDLGDSSEAFAENLNYSADSSIAARGGSIFKRLRRYLIGGSHETHAWNPNPAADPSATTTDFDHMITYI